MKFGKYLQLQMLPEWRDSYVNYRRLKRLLKQSADGEDEPPPPTPPRFAEMRKKTPPLIEPLLDAGDGDDEDVLWEKFSAILNDDLERVAALVAQQVARLTEQLELLLQQAAPATPLIAKRPSFAELPLDSATRQLERRERRPSAASGGAGSQRLPRRQGARLYEPQPHRRAQDCQKVRQALGAAAAAR